MTESRDTPQDNQPRNAKGKVLNRFASDTHRRVAAQCMRPRSALEVAYALRKHDPNVQHGKAARDAGLPDAHHWQGAEHYLAELEAEGLVVNLGTFESAQDALKAQDGHKEAINFEGDRDVFVNAARKELGFPFLDQGDHYVLTQACWERLTGATETEDVEPVAGMTDERRRELFGEDNA
jgi:hypothetical protein